MKALKNPTPRKRAVPTAAAALIAKAREGQHTSDPSADALKALQEILEYNDGAPRPRRVSCDAVLEMLHAAGWQGARCSLDALCRRRFGRRSYGTP